MTDAPLTLKSIFFADPAKPVADEIDLTAIKAAIGAATAALPPGVASNVLKALRHALDEIFQLDLGDVFQSSWSKAIVLTTAIEATRKDPDGVAIVPLLDHKISSTHKPHIDLMYGNKSLGQIAFDITLNLALKGVALEVRQGRIVGLKAGLCVGQGVFSFAGKPLLDRTTPELALPGRVAFTRHHQGPREDSAKPKE